MIFIQFLVVFDLNNNTLIKDNLSQFTDQL